MSIKKVDSFSDSTDNFHLTYFGKIGEINGKIFNLKISFENFTDALVDIQRQFEIIGKWNWRDFLIRQIFLEFIFLKILQKYMGKF